MSPDLVEKMERELEAYGDRVLTKAERIKSVLDSAVAALKTTLIINGAAAVAILGS